MTAWMVWVCFFGHLLTNSAQLFADVRTYWSPESLQRTAGYTASGCSEDGIIHLINSGAASLDLQEQQLRSGETYSETILGDNCSRKGTLPESNNMVSGSAWFFPRRWIFIRFSHTGDLPLTMSRLNLVKGWDGITIAEGYSVTLPENVHNVLNERTDPTWPTTWFAPILTGQGPFKDVYSVMNNWGANHASISYGHIGYELISLASILRIPYVCIMWKMKGIFRPSGMDSFWVFRHTRCRLPGL